MVNKFIFTEGKCHDSYHIDFNKTTELSEVKNFFLVI